MGQPMRVTVAAGATSNALPLNYRHSNYSASLICDVLTLSPTYTVQVTGDDVQAAGYSAAAGNWINHSSAAAQTVSSTHNLGHPATALRMSVTGTGSVRLTVIEPDLLR